MNDFTPCPYANQLELWRDVVGYEGIYQVSNLGQVKALKVFQQYKAGRILKSGNCRGYRLVTLCNKGTRKSVLIHQIVASSFLGKQPTPLHEVNHINSDRADNRLENLEWVTRKENIQHSITFGNGSNRGDRSPNAKLTWEQVREIRKLHTEKGLGARRLSKVYKVATYTIDSIINNRTWKEVLPTPPISVIY